MCYFGIDNEPSKAKKENTLQERKENQEICKRKQTKTFYWINLSENFFYWLDIMTDLRPPLHVRSNGAAANPGHYLNAVWSLACSL